MNVGKFVLCHHTKSTPVHGNEARSNEKKTKEFGRNKFKWSILYANQKDLRFFFVEFIYGESGKMNGRM